MTQENIPDDEVEGWLNALGVQSPCQWDVLVFLHRHPTSLLGSEYIARLIGYPAEPVLAALDGLESLGLVSRSRVSQNVRLYQYTVPPDPLRGEALERLQALADHREGRLRLTGQLRRKQQPPPEGPEATRRFPEEAQRLVRAVVPSRRKRDGKRGDLWRKAI